MVEIKNVRIRDLLSLLNKMSRDGVEVIDMLINVEERSVMVVPVDSGREDEEEDEYNASDDKITDEDIEGMI